ncbi:hypothetical protein GCM10007420_13250 [Glycocaulis albus]|uniref:Uncharacterized protein n=1 Tax=Glycocaulis albus TaxID=1382801 RepID=A0ABQ1XNG4_9PROT|nr:hypothetical protein [Glycocaulis albus]GGG98799.1 hypothetical protein GCM10007420_13250 [Glycocaulis albus]
MPIVTEVEVKSLLTPFHDKIRTVFEGARAEVAVMEAFRRGQGMRDYRYPRTLADSIYDAMANLVGDVFDDENDVSVIFEPQSFKVLFYPRGEQPILARFKKGDEEGRGQNHLTQTVIAFTDPEQCLPGFPKDAACIDITYASDELGTKIEKVLVVYRDGDRVLWSYSISDIGSEMRDSGNVLPFAPIGDRPDSDDQLGALVLPKASDEAEKEPSGE